MDTTNNNNNSNKNNKRKSDQLEDNNDISNKKQQLENDTICMQLNIQLEKLIDLYVAANKTINLRMVEDC